MEPETICKKKASMKSRMSAYFILFLASSFLMQSCFTTRYVSNEDILMREFRGASVDDIEFRLGEPDNTENLRNGYAYTYYYHGRISKRETGEMYERYMFDNNDNLRNIQSTNTVPKKQFNVGATIFSAIFFPVAVPLFFTFVLIPAVAGN